VENNKLKYILKGCVCVCVCVCVHKIYGGLEMIQTIMEVPVCNIEVGLPHPKKQERTKKHLNCVEIIMDLTVLTVSSSRILFFAN
jgi:hypothetical protein